MYIPDHFAIKSTYEAYRIIEAHPLGILVTSTEEGLDANHLPFELDAERGVLTAHVARANPVWKKCGEGTDALVIFRGEESYISPNWYPSKHELHRQVPTWNYQVVHIHGRLVAQDQEKFVRGVVARLTRTHEAIVGIEIQIERLEGKAKLSQNREARDRLNAAEKLISKGSTELVGKAMLKKA